MWCLVQVILISYEVTMTKHKASYGNSYLNDADNDDANPCVQEVSFKCVLQLCETTLNATIKTIHVI